MDESKAKMKHRAKFLKFKENRRPAFHGTWRKKSMHITARRPFARDQVSFAVHASIKTLTYFLSTIRFLTTKLSLMMNGRKKNQASLSMALTARKRKIKTARKVTTTLTMTSWFRTVT